MQWLKSFKIALIEEDEKKLKELIDTIPTFKNIDEMKEAFALISQAISMLKEKREKIQRDMNRLNKTKAFLNSHSIKSSYEIFS